MNWVNMIHILSQHCVILSRSYVLLELNILRKVLYHLYKIIHKKVLVTDSIHGRCFKFVWSYDLCSEHRTPNRKFIAMILMLLRCFRIFSFPNTNIVFVYFPGHMKTHSSEKTIRLKKAAGDSIFSKPM